MGMARVMRPMGLVIVLVLGFVPPLQAATPPAPAVQAEIIYLDGVDPGVKASRRLAPGVAALAASLLEQQPGSQIAVFQGRSVLSKYLLLQRLNGTSTSRLYGGSPQWRQTHRLNADPENPRVRAFILHSTLLLGNPSLRVDPSAFVRIRHVDVVPLNTSLLPPLYVQLESQLKRFKGFQGIQVWTAEVRPNHWTVMEVWTNQEDSQRADADASLNRIWDAVNDKAGSPDNQQDYRLVQQLK